jgi:thioredoxin reductase
MQNGTVTGIQPVAVGDGTFFVTTDAEGNQYTSRKVVLGTGLMDLIPDTPGLQENWSQGIFWCPWCDGYEHRDQPLGLLGPLVKLPDAVEEIETLNADLIAFVNGTLTDANVAALDASHPQWESMLQTYNVTIENRTIASFERLQDGADVFSVADKAEYDQFLVTLDDGTQVERAAFLASFPWTQRSDLGQNLGVEIDSTGKMYANWTGGMETNIPGVYAVGDANSDDSTNVPHAMWSGKRAAVNMHGKCPKDNGR